MVKGKRGEESKEIKTEKKSLKWKKRRKSEEIRRKKKF